jgi:hypothetical protein
MAVKMSIVVFWIVTLCSLVDGYKYFKGICASIFGFPKDEGSITLPDRI